jgi:hypothetical protein
MQMLKRYETVLFLLAIAGSTGASEWRSEDAVLTNAWNKSREVAASEPVAEVRFYSVFPLEHAMARAYHEGESDLLSHYAAAGIPGTGTPVADWPVVLERLFQWTGMEDTDVPWIEYATDAWLDAFLGRFSRDCMLRPSNESVPESWTEFVGAEQAQETHRFIESALLHRGAEAASRLRRAARLPVARYEAVAESLRYGFLKYRWDKETGLYRIDVEIEPSPWLNSVALASGLWPHDGPLHSLAGLIRKVGTGCPPEFEPMLVESAIHGGAVPLSRDLMSFVADFSRRPMTRVLVEGFGGIALDTFAGHTVRFSPPESRSLSSYQLRVHVPNGRFSVRHDPTTGFVATVPLEYAVATRPREGAPIMTKNSLSHTVTDLTEDQRALLESAGWGERVGERMGVWVSVDEQVMRVIEASRVIFQATCATAANGVGSQMNSLKTPLGWHTVAEKIGDGARRGQVFRARIPTRQIWRPGDDVVEDMVLTRILWLTGLEPGKNKGGSVDSYARNIYIHGTNDEARIGTPSSHGCVRLTNDDVVEAFRIIPAGTPVLISDGDEF